MRKFHKIAVAINVSIPGQFERQVNAQRVETFFDAVRAQANPMDNRSLLEIYENRILGDRDERMDFEIGQLQSTLPREMKFRWVKSLIAYHHKLIFRYCTEMNLIERKLEKKVRYEPIFRVKEEPCPCPSEEAPNPHLRRGVDELEVPIRIINTLKQHNINFLYELVQESPAGLSRCSGLGRKSIRQIRDDLSVFGLFLGMRLDGFKI